MSVERLSVSEIQEYLDRYAIHCLYYMVHMDNLPSIIHRGILSHNKAEHLQHQDVSLSWMQDQREKIVPVSGKPLHEYVPLYFATHTPMQYIITHNNQWGHPTIPQDDLIFIEISPLRVFITRGVVFTDGNAGRYRAKFYTNIADLDKLHWDIIRKRKVMGSDTKLWKCAEVLVPDVIRPAHFSRIVMHSDNAEIRWYKACEKYERHLLSTTGDTSWKTVDEFVKLGCEVDIDPTLY